MGAWIDTPSSPTHLFEGWLRVALSWQPIILVTKSTEAGCLCLKLSATRSLQVEPRPTNADDPAMDPDRTWATDIGREDIDGYAQPEIPGF